MKNDIYGEFSHGHVWLADGILNITLSPAQHWTLRILTKLSGSGSQGLWD